MIHLKKNHDTNNSYNLQFPPSPYVRPEANRRNFSVQRYGCQTTQYNDQTTKQIQSTIHEKLDFFNFKTYLCLEGPGQETFTERTKPVCR